MYLAYTCIEERYKYDRWEFNKTIRRVESNLKDVRFAIEKWFYRVLLILDFCSNRNRVAITTTKLIRKNESCKTAMRLRENASRAATSPRWKKSSTTAVRLTFKGYESNEFNSGQSYSVLSTVVDFEEKLKRCNKFFLRYAQVRRLSRF